MSAGGAPQGPSTSSIAVPRGGGCFPGTRIPWQQRLCWGLGDKSRGPPKCRAGRALGMLSGGRRWAGRYPGVAVGMCSCLLGLGMKKPPIGPLGEVGRGRVTFSPAPATHGTQRDGDGGVSAGHPPALSQGFPFPMLSGGIIPLWMEAGHPHAGPCGGGTSLWP